MKDPELTVLIEELETRDDISMADFDGVVHALQYLLPDVKAAQSLDAAHIGTTDHAMHLADAAYPNWVVHIRGRTNDKDGHWRVTLRETDSRDSDAVVGVGHGPVLAQAILATVLRLAMVQRG